MSREDGLIVSSVRVEWPDNLNLGEIEDALNDNIAAIANTVYKLAKNTTAFKDKTGLLRRSISKGRISGGWRIWAKAPHAHLIEFGHAQVSKTGKTLGYTSAHPFLRPARERAVNEFIASIGWSSGSSRAGSFIG